MGSGRRAFGSEYHRVTSTDEVKAAMKTDMTDKMTSHGAPEMHTLGMTVGMMIDVPPQRATLNLKPRGTPKEDDSSASMSQSSRAASLFGGGKPVGTTAREQVEEPLQKEQEKLQRQLDEPKLEQRPLERHPSRQSEKTQEREWSRTGSESSWTGTSATSGRNARRRKSEKSPENETPNKEENCQSLTSKPPKPEQPLKVTPAPPQRRMLG